VRCVCPRRPDRSSAGTYHDRGISWLDIAEGKLKANSKHLRTSCGEWSFVLKGKHGINPRSTARRYVGGKQRRYQNDAGRNAGCPRISSAYSE
jgi:hypothetical protein